MPTDIGHVMSQRKREPLPLRNARHGASRKNIHVRSITYAGRVYVHDIRVRPRDEKVAWSTETLTLRTPRAVTRDRSRCFLRTSASVYEIFSGTRTALSTRNRNMAKTILSHGNEFRAKDIHTYRRGIRPKDILFLSILHVSLRILQSDKTKGSEFAE